MVIQLIRRVVGGVNGLARGRRMLWLRLTR